MGETLQIKGAAPILCTNSRGKDGPLPGRDLGYLLPRDQVWHHPEGFLPKYFTLTNQGSEVNVEVRGTTGDEETS